MKWLTHLCLVSVGRDTPMHLILALDILCPMSVCNSICLVMHPSSYICHHTTVPMVVTLCRCPIPPRYALVVFVLNWAGSSFTNHSPSSSTLSISSTRAWSSVHLHFTLRHTFTSPSHTHPHHIFDTFPSGPAHAM